MSFCPLRVSIISLCVIAGLCAETLVVNGGFELGDADWSGWARTKDVRRAIVADAYTGNKAAFMAVSNGTVGMWSQKLPALTRGIYRLSAMIRTESVSSVQIKLEHDKGALGSTEIVSGTHAWRRIRVTVNCPDVTSAFIRIVIMKDGSAWFDDISLEAIPVDNPITSESIARSSPMPIATAEGFYKLAVRGTVKGNILAAGEPFTGDVFLEAYEKSAAARILSCVLRDGRGKSAAALRYAVPDGVITATNIRYVFTAPAEGFYTIDVRLETEREELATAVTTAVVLPRETPTGRTNNFGVVAHLKHVPVADMELRLDLLSRMGANWVREGFLWDLIEPQEGVFRWERFDAIVSGADKRGVRVLPIAAYGSVWASTAASSASAAEKKQSMPKIDAWERYVTALAKRYGSTCPVWEIWNEPNGLGFWKPYPDAALYAELLAAAYASIKRVNPALKVMVAGFSPKYHLKDQPKIHEALFLKTIYEKRPRPFDYTAYHPYTAPATDTSNAAIVKKLLDMPSSLRDVLAAHNDEGLPMWFTEMGTPTRSFMTKERAAEYLVLLFVKALTQSNIGPCFWYDLVDDGTNQNDSEHNFGLLHRDYTPKPGFYAYHTLVKKLGNASFADEANSDGISRYHFRDKEKHIIVAWADGPSPCRTALPNGGNCSVSDYMGAAYPADGGKIVIGESPVYIEYSDVP